MVTANAVFKANGRIYHLAAGYPVLGKRKPEDHVEAARKRLNSLLEKFEVLGSEKPRE